MEKLGKRVTNLHMGWKQVLLFSLAVGVFCGIFGGMPALADTSFTDMAGGYEWWVIFAVLITVNCTRFWDAGLKCGVFFLITQPLQFFLQALLYSKNFDNAWHYTLIWLPVIAATVPGGMIAHFAGDRKVWGGIVLGLGNTIEAVMGVHYVYAFLKSPPRHLIAAAVSVLAIVVFTFTLQKSRRNRILALAIPVVLTVLVLFYVISNGLQL